MVYLIDRRKSKNDDTIEYTILKEISKKLRKKLMKDNSRDYLICIDESIANYDLKTDLKTDLKASLYGITKYAQEKGSARIHNILSEAEHNKNEFIRQQSFKITNNLRSIAMIHLSKQNIRIVSHLHESCVDLTSQTFIRNTLSEIQMAIDFHNYMTNKL